MTQTRCMSLVEATANTVVGFVLAVAGQLVVFPVFGVAVTISQSFGIGALFTGLSLLRSYALRRLFTVIGQRR